MTLFEWFIPIRVVDLIEIGIVAFILYKLYVLMRGTIAVQIFLGIVALSLVQIVVAWADMTMLQTLFRSINEVFAVAVIILFQPEIRRVLFLLGKNNPLAQRFFVPQSQESVISDVISAIAEMSKQRIGALIVFERQTGLRNYIETGTPLQAAISRDLLIAIFFEKNPLHDGALIIRNQRIEAARCILPVSNSNRLSPNLGLRHRAAVGLTEQTDAFVVVVSEETGHISISKSGELISRLTAEELRSYLTDALA
ncbi:MAG: diadenylate cyclase CdaA [Rhodothermales bacterium]|nr:diadenylate cyclase CdaA [Rhodothermales bacterium]